MGVNIAEARRLRHRESPEDPCRAGSEAEAGIAGRDAEEDGGVDADGGVGEASAETHRGAAVGSGRGLAAPRVRPAVDFADDFEPLTHCARDGKTVRKDVVLTIAARRIPQNAQTDVADEPDRLNGLA